jgi:hypothetical protein
MQKPYNLRLYLFLLFISQGGLMIVRNCNTFGEALNNKESRVGKKHNIFATKQWSINPKCVLLPLKAVLLCWFLLAYSGCGSDNGSGMHSANNETIVVNSLDDPDIDIAWLPKKPVTLRSAIERINSGGKILFDPALNGKTIKLSIVGSSHTVLMGEVYSGAPPQFQGYTERDYGKSALYAKKDITIDASALPDGITIMWTGGDSNRARVLAVFGNLTMRNVTITSGYASAEAISKGTQPYTLARGGGLAVWGFAQLEHCTISGNKVEGDLESSRDRGTYGGGIYANGLIMKNCIVSGNSAIGYGAAGGGIYSVGGADNENGIGNLATLTGCTISGNRVTGQHAYGGGIFSLAGGPNNLAWLQLKNCTVARNLVEDHPGLADAGQFYYRGGGIYMGGGSLSVISCTIVENEVTGHLTIFSGKPNMGGGGIAATIGNAHVVENMEVRHSIVAGNTMNKNAEDLFTGSLLSFRSYGYNLIGRLDFSQILVPIPEWQYLSRKHWPKVGDLDGIEISSILALDEIKYHSSITSAGTDKGQNVVLWYPPSGIAADQIPRDAYAVYHVIAEYDVLPGKTDDFLNHVLEKLRNDYADILGSDFGKNFGDMTGITWHGPKKTWPTNPENSEWIKFWRDLDDEIGDRLGAVKLGDDFWESFESGPLGENLMIYVQQFTFLISVIDSDQLSNPRPSGEKGDIGAIEKESL